MRPRLKNAKRRQAVSRAALGDDAGHGCGSEVKAITSWVAPLADLWPLITPSVFFLQLLGKADPLWSAGVVKSHQDSFNNLLMFYYNNNNNNTPFFASAAHTVHSLPSAVVKSFFFGCCPFIFDEVRAAGGLPQCTPRLKF